jgi:6-phosphogluconolactonase
MLSMFSRRFRLAAFVFVALFAASAFAADFNVLVGTYTGPKSKGIYVFHFDPATGKFTAPQLAGETENPSFIAVDPHHRFVYAVNELENYKGTPSGAISVFSIDPTTAKLTFKQQVASLGEDPAYITVDHTGHDVLVANYTTGDVAVFPIKPDGTLGDHTALDQHQGSSVNPDRQKGPHAHSIQLTNDNRFAMSADLGLDKVIIYRFDPARGTLTPNNPSFTKIAPGSGPRHLAFSADSKFVYVIDEMGTTVNVFSFNPKNATMTEIQTISTVANHDPANTAAEIELSPDGRFLYTSTRKANVITQFAVDKSTGKLKFVDRLSSGGKTPRFFTLDPTGHWMLVAHQDSDSVVLFKVDKASGKLTPTGKQIDIGSPVCLVFLPESK